MIDLEGVAHQAGAVTAQAGYPLDPVVDCFGRLEDSGGPVLVSEKELGDGQYLGHLWLTEKHDGLASKRVLEVTTMAVIREARGQGYGRVLMQKAEAEAKARGIDTVELSVAGNNRRARDLYRDLGYDTTSRTMRKHFHP